VYTESQLRAFLGLERARANEPTRIVAYCRVSSAAQRRDLANRRRVLEEFAVARGLYGLRNYRKSRKAALRDAEPCT